MNISSKPLNNVNYSAFTYTYINTKNNTIIIVDDVYMKRLSNIIICVAEQICMGNYNCREYTQRMRER